MYYFFTIDSQCLLMKIQFTVKLHKVLYNCISVLDPRAMHRLRFNYRFIHNYVDGLIQWDIHVDTYVVEAHAGCGDRARFSWRHHYASTSFMEAPEKLF